MPQEFRVVAEALAAGIVALYRNPGLRRSLATAACRDVENFDVHRAARLFLTDVAKVAPEIDAASLRRELHQEGVS